MRINIMESYGLNSVFQYVELLLDSKDTQISGADFFRGAPGLDENISTSWPKWYMNTKTINVAGAKVLQAEIPFVWDIVTISNNTFILYVDGLEYSLSVSTGTPTPAQLAAEMEGLIQAYIPSMVVTWNSQTLRFSFVKDPGLPTEWGFKFLEVDIRNIAPIIGFFNKPGGFLTLGDVISSPQVAIITGPFYLYLNSLTMGPLINTILPDGSRDGGNGNQICRVPVNVQPGSVVFYNDPGIV